MADLNSVCISGNLVRDPELKEIGEDNHVCNLRIASNSRRKVDGEWAEVAGFYDVAVFGRQAVTTDQYLEKGRKVIIDGRLEFREWEQDEKKRSAVSIVANNVVFVGGRDDDDDAPARASGSVPF